MEIFISTPPIVLASSSPYRRELLARLGLEFTCVAPEIDESRQPGEDCDDLAMRLAQEKAKKVAATLETGLVIGSDQVADLKGKLLVKPGTLEVAREQLAACSGNTVVFNTAVTVIILGREYRSRHLVDNTRVIFRRLTHDEIEDYLVTEPALDCAGGFKSEGLGISLFESIDSSDPTALIGLPLIGLARMLREEGIKIP